MSRPLRQNGSIKEAGKFGPRFIQQHTYKIYYQIPFYQLPLAHHPPPPLQAKVHMNKMRIYYLPFSHHQFWQSYGYTN